MTDRASSLGRLAIRQIPGLGACISFSIASRASPAGRFPTILETSGSWAFTCVSFVTAGLLLGSNFLHTDDRVLRWSGVLAGVDLQEARTLAETGDVLALPWVVIAGYVWGFFGVLLLLSLF